LVDRTAVTIAERMSPLGRRGRSSVEPDTLGLATFSLVRVLLPGGEPGPSFSLLHPDLIARTCRVIRLHEQDAAVNVLVIGSGGREHALVWKLVRSPRLGHLYCAPGNAGIERLARCVPIPQDDLEQLKAFAIRERIGLTVVGPEAPLALGIADEFRKAKLKVFGPTRGAARIESSKAFAKDLMLRHHIRTAASETFEAVAPALEYLKGRRAPIVVKADGLAQGKGVVVATTLDEATTTVEDMLGRGTYGSAGRRVIIEEFLDGDELTIMAFTDGKTVVPMVASQDHKRVGDRDTGPNTGGMGAYAPAPLATPSLLQAVHREVFQPVVQALSRLGSPFHGVLYAGLMVVAGIPYVLEFNARFGDPETQVVLPLLKTDLLEVLEAVVEHRLDQLEITWHQTAAVCVVLTSGGYPGSYKTELPIHGLPGLPGSEHDEVLVFHAGTKRKNGDIVTAGGRVLGITGVGSSLLQARERAYGAAAQISFEGRHLRTDIAMRALRQRT
jgi:phosphoribosylamine---glycine ligase